MTWIWGYQWWWIWRKEYTYDHYNHGNVFGWSGMQFTETNNKWTLIFKMLLKLHFIVPFLLFLLPFLKMLKATIKNDREDGVLGSLCLFPIIVLSWIRNQRWWRPNSEGAAWGDWIIFGYWLLFIFPLSLIIGLLFFIIWYPIIIVKTYYKVTWLIFRDWRWLKE